jgi:hypothetical protein
MSVIFSSRKACYCAFCRSERKVYQKKNIGLSDVLGSALSATLAMFALFQEFDPRVLLIFVAFLAMAEVFVQVRWRLTIVCKYCGFDPVLYLKDTALAVEKVKIRLDQRKKDPATLLANPLQIPKLSRSKAELLSKAQAGGALVNKRV